MISSLRKFLLLAALCVVSLISARAEVNISVHFAPPAIPVYTQPPCPEEGYLWTPGYWAYEDAGYYWVPGAWVEPPSVGVLWTPGYWGYSHGVYAFNDGYWGPEVGFYGGINYGFGYGGYGYGGGRWEGDRFRYNTAVTQVNRSVIQNTYVDKTVVKNVTREHTSFNGGPNGTKATPNEKERQAMTAAHVNPTPAQLQRRQEASQNKAQFASGKHAKPATLVEHQPAAAAPKTKQHAESTPPPSTHVGPPRQASSTAHVASKHASPAVNAGMPEERPVAHVESAERHSSAHVFMPDQHQASHASVPRQASPMRAGPPQGHQSQGQGDPKAKSQGGSSKKDQPKQGDGR